MNLIFLKDKEKQKEKYPSQPPNNDRKIAGCHGRQWNALEEPQGHQLPQGHQGVLL